ncbi:MAG: hypothetical protein E7047_04695 [Lentisphaerae bacterium]|nr:hypothetical protein [Lentisphaerota bacterium]
MYSHRFFILLTAVVAAVFAAGCASVKEEPAEPGHIKLKRPDKIVYEQIPNAGCELIVPQDIRAVAGNQCLVNVQLLNGGRRSLVIKEWYMIDNYNFSIFYRRLPSNKPADPQAPFQRYTPTIPLKPLPQHSELRLHPGNRAMLTVELPFVAQLLPGDSAVYEVCIASSLKTFKLASKRFTVYVE